MKVTNGTSFEVIAFGWHKLKGRRKDVRVSPGITAEVNGPYIFETSDLKHQVLLSGEITCHEAPDNEFGFHLVQVKELSVGGFYRGVTVCHLLDGDNMLLIEFQ